MLEQENRDVTSIVRAKLASGTLPNVTPVKFWIGPGTGQVCDACDLKIVAPEVEYETDMPAAPPLRFHRSCLAVWHLERSRLAAT